MGSAAGGTLMGSRPARRSPAVKAHHERYPGSGSQRNVRPDMTGVGRRMLLHEVLPVVW
jgi:hypothetical protein